MIVQEITGRKPSPLSLPAPSIRMTPIDEASSKDRIFAMAFPTLYPTGQADFNTPRLRKVDLNDYIQHLMCFSDGRFGQHPRWRFFASNILMRRKANSSARFYVSKASGLKDMTREELTDALLADQGLLPYIVRQGSHLTGTRPFWKNKSNSLQAQARFLSPSTSPVFVTFTLPICNGKTYTGTSLARRTWQWLMIAHGGLLCGMGFRGTRILLLTTWFYVCGPLQSTFYARCLASRTRGTGLSGRRGVLATPTPSFGFRLPCPLTRRQRKPELNSPSIGAW